MALTLTLALINPSQPAAPNCPCVAPTARAGGPSGSGRTQHVPVPPQPPEATVQRVHRVRKDRPARLETETPRHVWLRKPLPVRGNGTGVYSSAPGRVLAPYLRVDTAGLRCGPWSGQERTVSTWIIVGRTTANDDTGATSSAHLAESRPLPTIIHRFQTCLALYDRASSPRARVCGAWRENNVAAYY